jgi:hypothetical protein
MLQKFSNPLLKQDLGNNEPQVALLTYTLSNQLTDHINPMNESPWELLVRPSSQEIPRLL